MKINFLNIKKMNQWSNRGKRPDIQKKNKFIKIYRNRISPKNNSTKINNMRNSPKQTNQNESIIHHKLGRDIDHEGNSIIRTEILREIEQENNDYDVNSKTLMEIRPKNKRFPYVTNNKFMYYPNNVNENKENIMYDENYEIISPLSYNTNFKNTQNFNRINISDIRVGDIEGRRSPPPGGILNLKTGKISPVMLFNTPESQYDRNKSYYIGRNSNEFMYNNNINISERIESNRNGYRNYNLESPYNCSKSPYNDFNSPDEYNDYNNEHFRNITIEKIKEKKPFQNQKINMRNIQPESSFEYEKNMSSFQDRYISGPDNEDELYDLIDSFATLIQSNVRGFLVRKKVLRYITLAIYYQSFCDKLQDVLSSHVKGEIMEILKNLPKNKNINNNNRINRYQNNYKNYISSNNQNTYNITNNKYTQEKEIQKNNIYKNIPQQGLRKEYSETYLTNKASNIRTLRKENSYQNNTSRYNYHSFNKNNKFQNVQNPSNRVIHYYIQSPSTEKSPNHRYYYEISSKTTNVRNFGENQMNNLRLCNKCDEISKIKKQEKFYITTTKRRTEEDEEKIRKQYIKEERYVEEEEKDKEYEDKINKEEKIKIEEDNKYKNLTYNSSGFTMRKCIEKDNYLSINIIQLPGKEKKISTKNIFGTKTQSPNRITKVESIHIRTHSKQKSEKEIEEEINRRVRITILEREKSEREKKKINEEKIIQKKKELDKEKEKERKEKEEFNKRERERREKERDELIRKEKEKREKEKKEREELIRKEKERKEKERRERDELIKKEREIKEKERKEKLEKERKEKEEKIKKEREERYLKEKQERIKREELLRIEQEKQRKIKEDEINKDKEKQKQISTYQSNKKDITVEQSTTTTKTINTRKVTYINTNLDDSNKKRTQSNINTNTNTNIRTIKLEEEKKINMSDYILKKDCQKNLEEMKLKLEEEYQKKIEIEKNKSLEARRKYEEKLELKNKKEIEKIIEEQKRKEIEKQKILEKEKENQKKKEIEMMKEKEKEIRISIQRELEKQKEIMKQKELEENNKKLKQFKINKVCQYNLKSKQDKDNTDIYTTVTTKKIDIKIIEKNKQNAMKILKKIIVFRGNYLLKLRKYFNDWRIKTKISELNENANDITRFCRYIMEKIALKKAKNNWYKLSNKIFYNSRIKILKMLPNINKRKKKIYELIRITKLTKIFSLRRFLHYIILIWYIYSKKISRKRVNMKFLYENLLKTYMSLAQDIFGNNQFENPSVQDALYEAVNSNKFISLYQDDVPLAKKHYEEIRKNRLIKEKNRREYSAGNYNFETEKKEIKKFYFLKDSINREENSNSFDSKKNWELLDKYKLFKSNNRDLVINKKNKFISSIDRDENNDYIEINNDNKSPKNYKYNISIKSEINKTNPKSNAYKYNIIKEYKNDSNHSSYIKNNNVDLKNNYSKEINSEENKKKINPFFSHKKIESIKYTNEEPKQKVNMEKNNLNIVTSYYNNKNEDKNKIEKSPKEIKNTYVYQSKYIKSEGNNKDKNTQKIYNNSESSDKANSKIITTKYYKK